MPVTQQMGGLVFLKEQHVGKELREELKSPSRETCSHLGLLLPYLFDRLLASLCASTFPCKRSAREKQKLSVRFQKNYAARAAACNNRDAKA